MANSSGQNLQLGDLAAVVCIPHNCPTTQLHRFMGKVFKVAFISDKCMCARCNEKYYGKAVGWANWQAIPASWCIKLDGDIKDETIDIYTEDHLKNPNRLLKVDWQKIVDRELEKTIWKP